MECSLLALFSKTSVTSKFNKIIRKWYRLRSLTRWPKKSHRYWPLHPAICIKLSQIKKILLAEKSNLPLKVEQIHYQWIFPWDVRFLGTVVHKQIEKGYGQLSRDLIKAPETNLLKVDNLQQFFLKSKYI